MLSLSTSGHSRLQEKLDKWFWFILAILPIIFFILCNFALSISGNELRSFQVVVTSDFGVSDETKNILYSSFMSIFGPNGILPVFRYANLGVVYYLVYFCYVQVIHVFVDVIVFIPRFAHKIMSKAINFGD